MTTVKKRPAGATPQRPPMQWEVWEVDIASLRSAIPEGRIDPDKGNRPYLIISPSDYNSGGDNVLGLPLHERSFHAFYEVELKTGEAGARKDGFIRCHNIMTIQTKFLTACWGTLSNAAKQQDIKERIKDFLEL